MYTFNFTSVILMTTFSGFLNIMMPYCRRRNLTIYIIVFHFGVKGVYDFNIGLKKHAMKTKLKVETGH